MRGDEVNALVHSKHEHIIKTKTYSATDRYAFLAALARPVEAKSTRRSRSWRPRAKYSSFGCCPAACPHPAAAIGAAAVRGRTPQLLCITAAQTSRLDACACSDRDTHSSANKSRAVKYSTTRCNKSVPPAENGFRDNEISATEPNTHTQPVVSTCGGARGRCEHVGSHLGYSTE